MTAANTILEIISFSEFVLKMCQARNEVEKNEGYEAVPKIRSLEGLRSAGVKIQEDFKLTNHIFEDKVRDQLF